MNDFLPLAHGAEGKIWRASFSATSHIKMWDDDDAGVLYDARTGDTHFLDPVAMELLRLLSLSPRSIAAMAETLVSDMSPAFDDRPSLSASLLDRVTRAVQRLQDCGLASSLPA